MLHYQDQGLESTKSKRHISMRRVPRDKRFVIIRLYKGSGKVDTLLALIHYWECGRAKEDHVKV